MLTMIIFSNCLLSFSSCSFSMSEPDLLEPIDKEIDLGDIVSVGDPIDIFHTAIITPERIRIKSSFGHKYSFDGNVIQEDTGISADKVKYLLQKRIEENNICPTSDLDLL